MVMMQLSLAGSSRSSLLFLNKDFKNKKIKQNKTTTHTYVIAKKKAVSLLQDWRRACSEHAGRQEHMQSLSRAQVRAALRDGVAWPPSATAAVVVAGEGGRPRKARRLAATAASDGSSDSDSSSGSSSRDGSTSGSNDSGSD